MVLFIFSTYLPCFFTVLFFCKEELDCATFLRRLEQKKIWMNVIKQAWECNKCSTDRRNVLGGEGWFLGICFLFSLFDRLIWGFGWFLCCWLGFYFMTFTQGFLLSASLFSFYTNYWIVCLKHQKLIYQIRSRKDMNIWSKILVRKNEEETDEREMDKQGEVGQRGSFISWQWAVKILGIAVAKMISKMLSKPAVGKY